MNVGGGEDRKMKRKIEEEDGEREEEHFLSLSIFNNADMSKPLKVSKPVASSFGDNDDDADDKKAAADRGITRRKEFGCKYCLKKFKSSQALGGHQNAHRRERVIWKMEKELSTFGHPHHFCPFSSIITQNNHLRFPISRTSASSSSTFNPHHFHLLHHHTIGTHRHHQSHVPNWQHHHQGQPKPGLSSGMNNSASGNPNDVEEKKPDVSSSGLDLSLRL